MTTMQQYQHPITPQRGMFFHVFVTNTETGKRGYIGCFNSEDEAKQNAIEAVGIEGEFTVHPSTHRDPQIVKQEFKFKKFKESGKLWNELKPIKNIRRNSK